MTKEIIPNKLYQNGLFGIFLFGGNYMDGERLFFAAANTSRGFVSCFEDIFGGDERLYILKGGPGTGKSYFLKMIAERAEREGLAVERYICSSDPDSLDGVRVPEKGIAVFDGTSPHAWEPKIPGAREEILNLGQFWDEDALYEQRETIKDLSQKKKMHYDSALEALAVAGRLSQYRLSLVLSYVMGKKMEKAAKGFVKKLSGAGEATLRFQRAYGMKGVRTAQNGWEGARVRLSVESLYGVGNLYLKEILQAAREKGISLEYAPHPIMTDYPEAIYFRKDQVLITCEGKDTGKKVSSRRFLDSRALKERGKILRFLLRAEDVMTEQALSEFEKMKENHFALEDIYGRAMSFAEKEAYCEKMIRKFF